MTFLNILLATSGAQIGIGVAVVIVMGGLITYLVIQSRLKALRKRAVETLHRLQASLQGLNEALQYLNKYPDLIHIGDNIHASDLSQVIDEYLHFTDANILGDTSIGKKPMTKEEAQEFINRVEGSIKVIAPIQKNNTMLVEGIKTLDALEQKKQHYEQTLPDYDRRIQAIEAENTDWWQAKVSFTKFSDLTTLQTEIDQRIKQGWEFLRMDQSTEQEAKGITQKNTEATNLSQSLDQMAEEVKYLEETIQSYKNRLPRDLGQIRTLGTEIDQWQTEYTYVDKSNERQMVVTHEQKTRELSQETLKDWTSIIDNLDTALNTQLATRDYFVRFSEAHKNFENNLSHAIDSLDQNITQWVNQGDYTNLPSLSQFEQHIHAAKNQLDTSLAKAPGVDWLNAEKAALETIQSQETLIREFENYQVAHQEFLHLENEAIRLDQQARALEQVVILPNHPMLTEIEQKQQAIEFANNWFDKLDALKVFLHAMESYIYELSSKQEELRRLEDRCHAQMNEVKGLLQYSNLLSEESVTQIERLNMPNIQGMAHFEAFQVLDNALLKMNQLHERIYHKINQAQQDQSYGQY
ncbi:hypothetical protein BKI52_44760 [marine bacterium AO1-C]|nr:hypothetical protein BKI52_44760 [marine bacterium AO1-C]